MASYNRTIIMGNLTRNPELREAGSSHVCKFGMAVNRKYKDKEEVTFIDVESWGKTAELVDRYLGKGSSALVEGRLRMEQWEDKDGNKRSKLLVVADTVQFLGSKGEGKQESYTPPAAPKPKELDDEPPF